MAGNGNYCFGDAAGAALGIVAGFLFVALIVFSTFYLHALLEGRQSPNLTMEAPAVINSSAS
jgi:hypothetical protein